MEHFSATRPEGNTFKNLDQILKVLYITSFFARDTQSMIDDAPVEILPNLWLGNLVHALYTESVSSYKWDHVYNIGIRIHDSWQHAIDTTFIKIADDRSSDIKQWFHALADDIHSKLEKGEKIYVHCHQGASRSPTVIIAYLIKHRQMSYDDALEHVVKMRDLASPNAGFLTQLQEFHHDIHTNV